MRRPSGRPRLPRPHVSRRAAAGALVVVAVLVPGWFWLRDSPLVSVDHVRVTGVSGSQAADVRQAVVDAAEQQSTLNLDPAKIDQALAGFPVVAGVTVHAHPLHTVDVIVHEHVPVGALAIGGRRIAVAGDGTILAGTLTRGLPVVPLAAPPGGRQLTERKALRMVALLAAAPSALRARVTSVELGSHGLTAQLSNGPALYFGPAARLAAKWIAAARVLADYTSHGATYLDLRVPERPAAGGLAPATTSTPTTTPTPTPTTNALPQVQPSQ
jgi:cell division protein FtsQ